MLQALAFDTEPFLPYAPFVNGVRSTVGSKVTPSEKLAAWWEVGWKIIRSR